MLSALWIVLLGMAIIFAVLGILLLVMILLNKLVKPKENEVKKDKQ
jgi:Na+-transporting methylmalonyl-CoA/oxaloacetate decarboxylase gamma subunit